MTLGRAVGLLDTLPTLICSADHDLAFFVLSGIPDYRSEEVGLYARSNHKPIQHQEFVKYPKVRQRYWARNFIGWPRFSIIEPNITHLSITKLQKVGTYCKFCVC